MAQDIFANNDLDWLQGSGSPSGIVSANTGSKYVDLVTGFDYKNFSITSGDLRKPRL